MLRILARVFIALAISCNGATTLIGRSQILTCRYCGQEFEKYRTRRKLYCSDICASKDSIRRRRERREHSRIKKCEFCHNTFEPKRNDSKFCSNKCRQAAYRSKDGQVKPDTSAIYIYHIQFNDNMYKFINLIESKGVKYVIDIRSNTRNQTGFSKEPLKMELAKAGIKYSHLKVLDVPREIRYLYGKNQLSIEELEVRYRNHLKWIKVMKFIDLIKKHGSTILIGEYIERMYTRSDVIYPDMILADVLNESGEFTEIDVLTQ